MSAKAIDPDEIVIDAKSGMTGAGRAAKEEMLFSEVSEGFHAYGVGNHRHMAELDEQFSLAAGRPVTPSFTPHLVPMNRGILATIYVEGRRQRSAEDLSKAIELAKAQPFYGLEFEGRSFDCGSKVGFLAANVAYALKRPDIAPAMREEIKRLLAD